MHALKADNKIGKDGGGEFSRVQRLIFKHTAIVISDTKRDFVRSRISKRMRKLGITSLSEYCDFVESGKEPISTFTSQVTTNHTHFFREQHHFEFLVNQLSIEGIDKKTIWSSACSSGEEPYSIAISLAQNFDDLFSSGLRILASDLDEAILDTAKQGIYPEAKVSSLSKSQLKQSFIRGKNDKAGFVRIKKPLRDLITFKKINLVDSFPSDTRVDVIFCRNVVIYFDRETKEDLFYRFADCQKKGDLLFVGHSECLNEICKAYELVGSTVYKRL